MFPAAFFISFVNRILISFRVAFGTVFRWSFFFDLRSVIVLDTVCFCASFSINLICKTLIVQTRMRTWVTLVATQCPDHYTICTKNRGQEIIRLCTNVSCSTSDIFCKQNADFFERQLVLLLLGYFFWFLEASVVFLYYGLFICFLPLISFVRSNLSRPGFEPA